MKVNLLSTKLLLTQQKFALFLKQAFFQQIASYALLLVVIPIITSKKQPGEYNSPCEPYNANLGCNESMGLMCIDEGLKGYRCKCPSGTAQFSTVYDPHRKHCVGKAFNNCVRSSTQKAANETYCVENASCNASVYYIPLCMCDPGFLDADNGACVPAAKYKEPCNLRERKLCDKNAGLECIDDICDCRFETSQYSEEKGRCVSPLQTNCSFNEDCVSNAKCIVANTKFPDDTGRSRYGHGRKNFYHRPGSEPDYEESVFVATFGPPPYFGTAMGDPTGNDGGVSFSTLVHRRTDQLPTGDDGIPRRCECLPGYSETKDGICLPSYGFQCSRDLKTSDGSVCNPSEFLECMDAQDGKFRCLCRNPLNEKYDSKRKECVSLIGRKCRDHESYPECEAGGECVQGFCKCKEGTSVTMDGSCAKDKDEKCSPGECNADAGLVCHGKSASCQCVDSFLKFDPEEKTCVAAEGDPCGPMSLVKHSKKGDMSFRNGGAMRRPESSTNRWRSVANMKSKGSTTNKDVFIGCETGSCCVKSGGRNSFYVCKRREEECQY